MMKSVTTCSDAIGIRQLNGLVFCALKKGGHDNATVVVIRVPENLKKK